MSWGLSLTSHTRSRSRWWWSWGPTQAHLVLGPACGLATLTESHEVLLHDLKGESVSPPATEYSLGALVWVPRYWNC